MRKSEFVRDGQKWIRVSKKTARRLFDIDKKEIFFIPCKASLHSPWGLGLIYPPKDNNHTHFDQICNEFEYYNCNTAELGRTASFYAKEGEVM